MTTLYNLGDALQRQVDQVEQMIADGQDTDCIDVQDALRAMVAAEGDFSSKAERVGLYIKSLDADALAISTELDRLKKLQLLKVKRASSLTEMLKFQLESLGLLEIKGVLCPIKIKQNPWSVTVENVHNLPAEYQRIKTTVDPDKVLLLKNRESLLQCDGVRFERKTSIKIG